VAFGGHAQCVLCSHLRMGVNTCGGTHSCFSPKTTFASNRIDARIAEPGIVRLWLSAGTTPTWKDHLGFPRAGLLGIGGGIMNSVGRDGRRASQVVIAPMR